jgi:DNA-binding MarR family transcriptional regulator
VGEHRGEARAALAQHLHVTPADLDGRLDELSAAGYLSPAVEPDAPLELTPTGVMSYERLFVARQARIERLLAGWDPAQHPELLRLLDRFTHALAASEERPPEDLEVGV